MAFSALKLGCYVQVGLPTVSSSSSTSGPLYSNSTILVSPFGALVSVYSKHFLYETDFAWATPGPAFIALDLPFPPSSPFHSDRGRAFRLAPAICMDLNPKDFVAPFEAFEFASFAKQEKVDIVACSMSWLDSEPPRATAEEGEEEEGRTEWEKVHRTLGYWVMRMEPLMESRVAFVGCNRVGREGDTIFTGSSCAIELQDRPTVIKYATKRKEEVILAKVRLPPRED
ncbi:SPOSA6832_02001, partial [Sporobolomyces salmonicolor]